jgi:hypothetical protein
LYLHSCIPSHRASCTYFFCLTPSLHYSFCTYVLSHVLSPNPHIYCQFLYHSKLPLLSNILTEFLAVFNICNSLFLSHSLFYTSCVRNPIPPQWHLTSCLVHRLLITLANVYSQTISQMFHIFCVPHVMFM